jgi:proteasome lid subunit RPN8/RPN11
MIISLYNLNLIKRHAKEVYPEECCGLIVGKEERGYDGSIENVAYRIAPCVNELSGDRTMGFEISKFQWNDIHLVARQLGCDIVGTYHSHTLHGAFPSGVDCDFTPPKKSMVILALKSGVIKEMRSYIREIKNHKSELREEQILFRD